MKLAPVILFVYNRLYYLQQTVEALLKNELSSDTDLIVYSDAPKQDRDIISVDQVKNYIKSVSGFKSITIIERKKNYGLGCNIIEGVTEVVNDYGKAIVLEDDLVTAPFFLTFMNEALTLYQDVDEVANVHGHTMDIKTQDDTYFIRHADCLGWGTWQRSWKLFEPDGKKLLEDLKRKNLCNDFDFDGSYPYTRMLQRQAAGEVNSWAIRWYASLFLQKKLSINASKNLVKHIGLEDGIHIGKGWIRGDIFSDKLYMGTLKITLKKPIEENEIRKKQACAYRWKTSKIHKGWVTLLYYINCLLKKNKKH